MCGVRLTGFEIGRVQVAQWLLYLSQFDYSLTHRAGKHLSKPDALSRCVDHQVEGEDNEDQVMLSAKHFASEPPATGRLGPIGQMPMSPRHLNQALLHPH